MSEKLITEWHKGRPVWNDAAVAFLRAAPGNGLTAVDAAKRLGTSPHSTAAKYYALTRKRWIDSKPKPEPISFVPFSPPPPLREWPDQMQFTDVSPAVLAREFGTHRRTKSHPPIGPLTRVPGAGRAMAIPHMGGAR